YRQAGSEADRAIELGHEGAMPFGVRADVRLRSGDYTGALADADQVLQRDQRTEYRGQARLLKAFALESQGQLEAAFAEIGAGLEDNNVGDIPRADLHIIRSRIHKARGKLDEALVDANAAVKLMPAQPSSYANRALVRLDAGDFAGAIADADTVLEKAP